MNPILAKQLALDFCVSEADAAGKENCFSVYTPLEGRRRFEKENDCFLKIADVNGKLLVTGREDVVGEMQLQLAGSNAAWFMEAAPLLRLNEQIGKYGYRIRMCHPFFIAEEKTVPAGGFSFEIRRYDRNGIEAFRGDARFDEAFAFSETAPDVLAVAAVEKGEIIGMAGASADSPLLWQIGINVLPGAEGRGVGSQLVTLLKNDILELGRLPYYGTAMSHLASQKVALRSGFLPAWTELITERIPENKI